MMDDSGASREAAAARSASFGKHSVLVLGVDDDAGNLRLLKTIIESLGHHFIGVKSGAEALQIIENARPRIVLLDIMMPELDGFETCRRIRQLALAGRPRIIFVTALNEPDDVKQAIESGGDDYLVKPVEMSTLETRLHYWLSQAPPQVYAQRHK